MLNSYIWLVDVLQRIARNPSHPWRGAADATTVERTLCYQPVMAAWNPRVNPWPEPHKSAPTPGYVP